jgi:hypothetical protein
MQCDRLQRAVADKEGCPHDVEVFASSVTGLATVRGERSNAAPGSWKYWMKAGIPWRKRMLGRVEAGSLRGGQRGSEERTGRVMWSGDVARQPSRSFQQGEGSRTEVPTSVGDEATTPLERTGLLDSVSKLTLDMGCACQAPMRPPREPPYPPALQTLVAPGLRTGIFCPHPTL